ncbi:cytochrome P450 81D1-like [Eucalyptus grandis]|uniref:cytochrome P450 81D1-like n=1 Tax=Eucalyptus grandis TaxID=71139 RepID=UPI00192EAD5A|nr:cytochrome P450 81D1-like [Eucalyptus grandis]
MEVQNVPLVSFIISLITIVCTCKILLSSITRTPKKNHPPNPPSFPIVGHLLSLKKPVHRTLLALSRTHGPIISLSLGVRHLLVISSKSLAEECLQSPPNDTSKESTLTELTLNMMMRVMAGKRYYGEDVTDVKEVKAFRDMIEEVMRFGMTIFPADYLPVLRWIDWRGYEKRGSELGKKMDRLLQGLVDEHRNKEEEKEKSMIDHLLWLQASQPEYYTDEIIKGFVQTILFARTDTSSVTMEWALANLLNHPNMLEKARVEIDTQIGPDRLVDESDLSRLPYIHNIILETLRLHPPAPLLIPHYSSDDCEIGGYGVSRGTMVLINAWAIHRDPDQWSDPTSFKPERFESGDDKWNRLMLPFGLGRRACPGAQLAHKIMGFALASLIQCFEWKRIGEEEVDMTEGAGLTMPKKKPLEASYKPREIMERILSESSNP